MAPPYAADWHPARDVFAEYAGVLAIISRSWGRFGQEVFLLQTTDIAELVERRPTTAVGSSTLPHKNNPSLSEALMQRSRIIPRLAEIVGDDMINTFERDNTSRPNQQLDMISVETAQMLSEARRLVARLDVRTDTMRANLDRSGGWILSQRLVFALAPALGREHSEALMRELAASAIADGLSLRQALASNAEINETLSAQEIDALLDPATYLGQVGAQVDAVIAQARAAREADPVQ
jgi:adenylosuccinate lyase